MTWRGPALLPLFLISAASLGLEIALTRYFAVANWSEYGYWVISIVMAGFALSGVTLALSRDWALRRAETLQALLPVALIAAAAVGYHFTTENPFNPLELQNQATWLPQIGNIALYYVCLLPFFFLAGLFVGLSFVRYAAVPGGVYAFDLTGAGAGSLLVLALMYVLHPFLLVPALLLPLAAAAALTARSRRMAMAGLIVLLAGEALLLAGNQAAVSQYKAIYAPLHTPGSRQLAEILTPRGVYQVLDDFTERVDTDVSNDAGMLGLPGPQRTFGLYRDGSRIAALPRHPGWHAPYAGAALDAAPYLLRPDTRVLVAGASGGFRIAEALTLGARAVVAAEPDPVLRAALLHGVGPSPPPGADPRVQVVAASPIAVARGENDYGVIAISGDFVDEAEANSTAFTTEAIDTYLRALAPGGIISIPVSIRDLPVYAVRMLATVRAALLRAGIADPAAHVLVYRSAWNARILLSNRRFGAPDIARLRKFCDDRSFDVSWYPGIDVRAARSNIYNDLPAVSFDQGRIAASGPDDAIADEAGAVLHGAITESGRAFNLAPITMDRPFYYDVLRLAHLGTILRRLEVLPQQEIASLVNLAVLAQAVLIAFLVLLVPLISAGRVRAPRGGLLRPVLYFPALGLGYLFIEIFLIDKASFYLDDRTAGFALVLTGMLIGSGLGSLLADRVPDDRLPRATGLTALIVVLWCLALRFGLQPLLLATLDWPVALRIGLLGLVAAPAAVALGLPFPLGLRRAAGEGGGFLPWAWGLNGAFSVVATPLAALLAHRAGYDRLLLSAGVLYAISWLAYPSMRKSYLWQDISVL